MKKPDPTAETTTEQTTTGKPDPTQKIAFLGLGHMGAPMARRLLAAGHPVTVWNRTAAKAGPLVAEGARHAASPADAARDADVVITMLTGPDALAAVADAVLPALPPGARWIEMSTVGPDAVRALAARVGDRATLVDAPVTGSTDRAATGRLAIFAGGDTTGVDHVLATLGAVTRTGPAGSGAALKLVLNAAALVGIGIVAEALRLAAALGLDEDTARTALAAGPLAGAAARAFAEDVHFATALAVKDLDLAARAAQLPVVRAVSDQYRQAAAHEPALAAADVSRTARHLSSTPTGSSTMRVTLDDPADAPQPLTPYYSQVARVEQADGGALLFLSGQIAEGDTVAEQSRGVFETIAALLKAHGAGLEHIVSIRTYLTDIGDLPAYGAVRRAYLTGTPPTSMTMEVPRLFRPEARIEVEAVAAVPARL
ncbi:NAD(P)-binding domain-containing protein [Streptomyces similanensis]|uniref:6-phosphogluconate dehydrogenase NADP-binding domain-containing protein n=1 Tax=Streptomyces similanensis TaxID=1274988 RepID=A0ABP9KIM1_9ACTN